MSFPHMVQLNRSRLICATVLALASLVAGAARADTDPRITIDNFGRVNASYFRGAQPVGRDYNALAALGVKAVIDLTGDDGQSGEAASVSAAGMKYFHIPMTTHVAPTATQVEQFLSLVTDPGNQPVYVHCVGGSHRTGVMTAVYRMTNDRWAPDRAFAEMKTFKFGPDFLHSEFKKFVLAYVPDPMRTASATASLSNKGSD